MQEEKRNKEDWGGGSRTFRVSGGVLLLDFIEREPQKLKEELFLNMSRVHLLCIGSWCICKGR